MSALSKQLRLRDAAKLSGYTQDYLGFLIRKGKLKGVKIGRDWFVKKSDLDSFLATRQFVTFDKNSEVKRLVLSIAFGGAVVVGLVVYLASSVAPQSDIVVQEEVIVERQLNEAADDTFIDFSGSQHVRR